MKIPFIKTSDDAGAHEDAVEGIEENAETETEGAAVDEGDTSRAVAEKKKAQRRYIIVAAGAGAVIMSAAVMMKGGTSSSAIEAELASRQAAMPKPAAPVSAADLADVQAAMAKAAEPAGQTVPAGVEVGIGPAGEGGMASVPAAEPAGVTMAAVGAPGARIDEAEIARRVDALGETFKVGLAGVETVVKTGDEQILKRLDEISQKLGARVSAAPRSAGVTAKAAPAAAIHDARWRLVQSHEVAAVIALRSGKEYRLVRPGEIVPGLGRVSVIRDDSITVGRSVISRS